MSRLLGALAVVGLFDGPVAAQVSIQVVDPDGRPIPAAQVGVYGRAELIESESTSALGIAELGPDRWSEVRYIHLSHLGFQTRIVQTDDLPADGLIRLERLAIEIEGIEVTAREPCPIDHDPEAWRLWSEVASRYSRETGSRALSGYFSRYRDGVRQGELYGDSDGRPTSYVFAGHPGVIHGKDLVPRSLDRRIEAEGYAWPPLIAIDGTTTGRQRGWAYPELDRSQAHHFASPVFGELHSFAVVGDADGRVTLIFCGKGDRDVGTMNGILTLVPGEALVSAEWRYQTLDPQEGAGGAVTFASYVEAPGTRPHLVASRGVFYRRWGPAPESQDMPGYYGREISADQRWYVHPSAEHPCSTGYSLYVHPPRTPMDPPRTPDGVEFVECVAAHWGGG